MTARTRLTALALASVLVACLAGAGTGGRAPLADASRPARGTLDSDRLHGAFWRPAGSDATRPTLSLQRAAWAPWEIQRSELEAEPVRNLLERLRKTGKLDLEGVRSDLQPTLFE